MDDAATGKPVQLDFKTQTYDLELGHSTPLGAHQLLTFGGNVRHNAFDITVAPAGRDRSELGAYLQDEAYWKRLRLTLSARLDKFGNLERPVFSPRLSAQLLLSARHSLRLSYNRAFRSPSVLNNYLDLTIKAADAAPLVCSSLPELCAGLDPSALVVPLGPRAMGSEVTRELNPALPALKQESLTAYEAAYDLSLGHTHATLAAYVNDTNNNTNFVADPETLRSAGLPAFFSSKNPPPGWPFPLWLLDSPAPFSAIPAVNAYMNLGPFRNRGIELSVDHELTRGLTAALNYSWQDRPRSLAAGPGQIPFPLAEHPVPPRHRFNVTLSLTRDRFLGSLGAHHVSRAFWNDVLPSLDLVGYTPAFTLVDGSLGVRWNGGRITTLVKARNLLNQEIRQHLFGDVLKRGVVFEVRLRL
jgi:outer membrane receptor protein involved in Fe transport